MTGDWRWKVLLAGMLIGSLVGCRSSRPKEESPNAKEVAGAALPAETKATSPETASAEKRGAAEPQPVGLTEDEVRRFVDKWVAAQNAGQFADYETLYAEEFTGIKRVGARKQRFDRAGWLADRKQMFAKDFSVRLDELDLRVAEDVAVVEFTQTWASAAFKDAGRKRIVIERNEALRIASEEMLDSRVGEAPSQKDHPTREEFVFVDSDRRGSPILRLPFAEVDLNAVHGPVEHVNQERAERAVLTKALAPELRKLVGQRYSLYDAHSKVCEGTIDGFLVLVEMIPHFGMANAWNGLNGGEKASPEAIALDLWKLGRRSLVATLEGCGSTRGRWARRTSVVEPQPWTSRSPTSIELGAAMAAARGTALHREIQKHYMADFGKTEPWDTSGERAALVFEDGAGQQFVALQLMAHESSLGCGSAFNEVVVLMILRKKGGDYVVVSTPKDDAVAKFPKFPWGFESAMPDAAFDVDGDGRPEFLAPHDLLRETDEGYRSVWNTYPPDYDCRC